MCSACIYSAVAALHDIGVMHRFINPGSIYINMHGVPKLTDLRYCKLMDGQKSFTICGDPLYFAPEIVKQLGYDYGADLWSLGCIFAEMILGKPIFSGASTLGQIEQIVSLLGWPDDEAKAAIDSKFTQVLLDSIDPKIGPDPNTTLEGRWRDIFPNVPDSAISLLCNLLVWAPHNRIKAVDGLVRTQQAAFERVCGAASSM